MRAAGAAAQRPATLRPGTPEGTSESAPGAPAATWLEIPVIGEAAAIGHARSADEA